MRVYVYVCVRACVRACVCVCGGGGHFRFDTSESSASIFMCVRAHSI